MQISPLTTNAVSKKKEWEAHSFSSGSGSGKVVLWRKKGEWQPFLAKRVTTFCVEPSSTELLTLIKNWHIISWQVLPEEEYGTKTIGIIALPGLAQSTQLWREQLSQQTGHLFLCFSLYYTSLMLCILSPLSFFLFLSFFFFLKVPFL